LTEEVNHTACEILYPHLIFQKHPTDLNPALLIGQL
jgi:hypothetical protein